MTQQDTAPLPPSESAPQDAQYHAFDGALDRVVGARAIFEAPSVVEPTRPTRDALQVARGECEMSTVGDDGPERVCMNDNCMCERIVAALFPATPTPCLTAKAADVPEVPNA
jgi:hypothetical protein